MWSIKLTLSFNASFSSAEETGHDELGPLEMRSNACVVVGDVCSVGAIMQSETIRNEIGMKILFIIYGLSGGGAERVAANLMNWLSDDHEVTACLLEPRKPEAEYPLSDRVRVVVLPQYATLRPLVRYWKLASDLRALKRHGGFDIAVSFLELGNFLNAITRGVFGPRSVISIRNHASRKIEFIPPSSDRIKLMKIQGKCAHRVVCVSEDVALDQIEQFGVPKRKVRVINNWIDANVVRAQAAEPLDDSAFEAFAQAHPFLFANMGRLNVQKGQWHLIRAFGKVHETHPDTGLLILGEGRRGTDIQPQLEEVVKAWGLEDCVLFAGRKANPFQYLKRAHVFVLPSLFEGFSNAILEAMSLGLPIVASDCSGVRECLTPGRALGSTPEGVLYGEYGIVTPVPSGEWPQGTVLDDQEAALFEALMQLYEHPDLRDAYGTMSLACVKRYDPQTIIRQWIEVLRGR